MKIFYDAIVIGAGHAGVEAALALAKTGAKTLVLSITPDNVGYMACNPSIGGTGKGHLVRELDALGGFMGIAADNCATQIRMLNASKGLAVRSLRAQEDKYKYHAFTKRALEEAETLSLRQDEVKSIARSDKDFTVECVTGSVYSCRAVVVATGVYMDSAIITGSSVQQRGPVCFPRSDYLAQSLTALGFRLRRFKTGTPARLLGKSIDFSRLEVQEGDTVPYTFSALTKRQPKNTTVCYLGYTNEKTHDIIRAALDFSPRKLGLITGTGARYCPSIEDKIVRFADKPRHAFFLEPEGAGTDEWYIQGISTSLPPDVQRDMYRSIDGLENVHIVRDAYAIEYECIDARELYPSLMSKRIDGLFFAGQVNGTSGYEEAAGQGILAGMNAALKLQGKAPFILTRDMAYIGVLADDLTTKGTDEPYRMMTSRAEHRLSLRQDNADLRLTRLSYEAGLADGERLERTEKKARDTARLLGELKQIRYTPGVDRDAWLERHGQPAPAATLTAEELLRRPEIGLGELSELTPGLSSFPANAREQVEIAVKYAGYLEKQEALIHRARQLEDTLLPEDAPYEQIEALRLEARQKLTRQKPRSLGAASRIPGVSPADIAVLMVWLEKTRNTTA